MKRTQAVWQKAMYLTSKPKFKADIESARRASNLPANGFRSSKEIEAWYENHIYMKANGDEIEEAIDQSVARIISKPEYGLSPGWHHSVKRFLFLNTIKGMQLPTGLESRFVYDELTDRPTMHVIVTEDITESDYKNQWKRIEEWRKREQLAPQRRQREANQEMLRRGKLAYELWVEGKNYEEIAPILDKKYPGVIKDTFTSPDECKTIIHNFMKSSGI